MNTDLGLLSFEENVKGIIDNGSYSWIEFKFLLSTFICALSECSHDDDSDGIQHGFFPKSIKDRFKGYEPLLYRQSIRNIFIGCSLEKKKQGKISVEIHNSGLFWDNHYFFIINCKFEFLGINRYEFELGEIDYTLRTSIIKSKVIFEGPEGSNDYPRIYLATINDGKLLEKSQ